jgi:hypothetical protein
MITAYGAFPAAPALRWPADGPLQQPGSYLDYTYLANAESRYGTDPIIAASLAVQPSGAGEMVPAALTVAGSVVTVWMDGGVAGRRYLVMLILTTLSGRVAEIPISLLVDPTLGVQPPPRAPSAGFGTPVVWAAGLLDSSGNVLFDSSGNIAIGSQAA